MTGKVKIICVAGPTAAGKTRLGVNICRAFGGEVISADSMQVYRGMHIASAAPDTEEMRGIPHHMLEFLDYDAEFTVYDYVRLAKKTAGDIINRGRIPVLVGGTGLYISSFVDNVEFTPQKTDKDLRERLTRAVCNEGAAAALERLRGIDPIAADRLHENDLRRIVRAFEIYYSTGLTPTEHNRLSLQNGTPYDPVMIGVTFADREKLYGCINARVDKMLENGLLEEAHRAFLQSGEKTSGASQAIGHKEFFDYFRGNITLEEATENLKRSTRRYAKRQLTWFGRDKRINWIYRDRTDDTFAAAAEILKKGGITKNE